MSGHSKWSQIKRQKGAADVKKGVVFTKMTREIMLAAREGGGDPEANFRLRLAVDRARAVNMPHANIQRAIDRATGADGGAALESIVYEGYAPGGVSVMVEAATDNRNRTVGELRHMLTKHNGNLAESNAVAWMFSKKGYIVVDKAAANEEALLNAVLEAGGDDLRDDGDSWEILSDPPAFEAVRDAVKALGVEPATAQIAMLPQNYIKLEGKDANHMLKLMDALDDHDDVKQVWSNFDIEEKEIEASLA